MKSRFDFVSKPNVKYASKSLDAKFFLINKLAKKRLFKFLIFNLFVFKPKKILVYIYINFKEFKF